MAVRTSCSLNASSKNYCSTLLGRISPEALFFLRLSSSLSLYSVSSSYTDPPLPAYSRTLSTLEIIIDCIGGSIARIPKATTCSRVVSWVSITLDSLTDPSPCPMVPRSVRPMVHLGWPFSAFACRSPNPCNFFLLFVTRHLLCALIGLSVNSRACPKWFSQILILEYHRRLHIALELAKNNVAYEGINRGDFF